MNYSKQKTSELIKEIAELKVLKPQTQEIKLRIQKLQQKLER
jgi:hypothetical protein